MEFREALYTTRAMRRVSDAHPPGRAGPDPRRRVRAPSGGNAQNWRFLIVDDPAVKAQLGPIYRECMDLFWAGRSRSAMVSLRPPASSPRDSTQRSDDANKGIAERVFLGCLRLVRDQGCAGIVSIVRQRRGLTRSSVSASAGCAACCRRIWARMRARSQAIQSTTFTTIVRIREPEENRLPSYEHPDPQVVRPSVIGAREVNVVRLRATRRPASGNARSPTFRSTVRITERPTEITSHRTVPGSALPRGAPYPRSRGPTSRLNRQRLCAEEAPSCVWTVGRELPLSGHHARITRRRVPSGAAGGPTPRTVASFESRTGRGVRVTWGCRSSRVSETAGQEAPEWCRPPA